MMDKCDECALTNYCEDQIPGRDGCSRFESAATHPDLVPVMGTIVKEVAAENDQLRDRLAAVEALLEQWDDMSPNWMGDYDAVLEDKTIHDCADQLRKALGVEGEGDV